MFRGGGSGGSGSPGPKGDPGNAATVAVGTTTTGTTANVTNSGTSTAAVLNFTLPTPNTSSIAFYQAANGWPVSNTATIAQTATSITIPANTVNANGRIEILVEYTITGTTTTKTLDITDHASGFVIATNGGTFSGSGYYGSMVEVSNRNSQTSQFIRNKAITVPFGTGSANGAAQNAGALDFTVDRTFDFNITFSATGGTETVRVESWQVRIWNP